MKQFQSYISVAIFSIFVGAQITEGVLLIPYWQSLSAEAFYAYYSEFGPAIGRFFTVLTIVAALIPIGFAAFAKTKHSHAFAPALISAILAIGFVASFYMYFKGANELFYQSAFSDADLKAELVIWSTWHWGRVVVECLSLGFLVRAMGRMGKG
ncbi:MAG: hypothetical protein AB8F78_11930 [Saprospiraceae bacterium]